MNCSKELSSFWDLGAVASSSALFLGQGAMTLPGRHLEQQCLPEEEGGQLG